MGLGAGDAGIGQHKGPAATGPGHGGALRDIAEGGCAPVALKPRPEGSLLYLRTLIVPSVLCLGDCSHSSAMPHPAPTAMSVRGPCTSAF